MTSTIDTRPRTASERLLLRPIVRADLARLACMANDYDVAAMTSSMPHPYALSDAEAFCDAVQAQDPARDVTFAIERVGKGVIGVLGFNPRDEETPEIGYWIGRPYWGRGYATEAVRTALAWVRSEWGRRAILALHFTDNPASAAVLIKAGFLYTGQVRPTFSRARASHANGRMMVWLA